MRSTPTDVDRSLQEALIEHCAWRDSDVFADVVGYATIKVCRDLRT